MGSLATVLNLVLIMYLLQVPYKVEFVPTKFSRYLFM